MVVEHL